MKKIILILLTICVFPLVACGSEPVIDASSKERLEQSSEKIISKLPPNKKEAFKESMKIILFDSIDLGSMVKNALTGSTTSNKSDMAKKMYSSVDGMTASQIILKADKIKQEREEKMRKQALDEILELETQKAKSMQDAEELKKFKIISSRFYKKEKEYSMFAEPIIEMAVRNDTSYPISRVYCEGVLASPGRSIPWLKETFSYEISGGLEPGEQDEWHLAPNSFSDWGRVDAPNDAILTITVYQLDGPEGKVLFSSDFSEKSEQRLEALKEKYGVGK